MQRYATSIFCDDIRNEIGSKNSWIGIYEGALNVPEVPIVLPKLCVIVRAATPTHCPFKKFDIFLKLGDLEHSVEVDTDSLVKIEEEANMSRKKHENEDKEKDSDSNDEDALFYEVGANIILSPFQITDLGRLRVRVETETETLQAGTLKIARRAEQGSK